jgi:cytoskeleton protein RodZ
VVAPTPTPAAVAPATVEQAEVPPAPAVSPTSAAAAPVATVPSPQSRILLRANADAWVQVRDRAGAVLLNRLLHPGDTWEVPPRPNLVLTTGNAGGTELVVDGVATPSLGSSGMVRRELPLDPDLIKDGKLVTTGVRNAPQ